MTFSTLKTGFSLVEIVFALILFSAAVLPIFGVLTHSMGNTASIESHRFAQEQAYNIINLVLDSVYFELLTESDGEWQPGSMTALSNPSTVNGVVLNNDYVEPLRERIFPGSLGATYAQIENGGIVYEMLLEIKDVSSDGDFDFSTAEHNNPSTWNELFFDYYQLPSFSQQQDWNHIDNQQNNAMIQSHYVTPYRYFDEFQPDLPGRKWGPAERRMKGQHEFGQLFPITQKDRTNPWPDWDNKYCQMKRLRLRVRWNIDPAGRKDPTKSARRVEFVLVAFKSNI